MTDYGAMTASIEAQQRIALPRDCSFHPTDWDVLSTSWFPVARADEVEERPAKARLLDIDLVVYRTGGVARVARDLCFHRGAALSKGWVEGDVIVLPLSRLSLWPGRALRRRAGASRHGDTAEAAHRHVSDRGALWPDLDHAERRRRHACRILPPGTIRISSRSWRRRSTSTARRAARSKGFLDVAHFAWAHVETFGDRSNPIVPSYKVERTERGVRTEYLSSVSNYPRELQHRAPVDFPWLRVFEVFPPFAARLIVHFPEGGRLWILNAACPISARKTRLFCPLARNFDKDGSIEAVHDFNFRIFNEDRVIVESQKPEDLPLDIQMEAHIAADRTSIAYRKLLKEMGLGTQYIS